MKLLALSLATVFGFLLLASVAEARPQRGDNWSGRALSEEYGVDHSATSDVSEAGDRRGQRSRRSSRFDSETRSIASAGGVGPRPSKWCGWWMRTQLGGGPQFNVAWNWSRYGSPGSPQVGAVVVWRHHVGMITGQAANGQWIVKSGNDSHRVRERARSIAGAVVRV